ncbi:hypothetical protein BGX26_007994, partial [Mortierella sp. AD094]
MNLGPSALSVSSPASPSTVLKVMLSSILTTVFTFNEGYMLAPQTYPIHNSQSMGLTVEHLVQNEDGVPVLGLEIKRAGDIELMQAGINADRQ